MARASVINNIRKYLIEEEIYTSKDEITLIFLENTYSQYVAAYKDVKKNGQTILQTDSNGKVRTVINPSFKNQLDLLKQLKQLAESLYLNPKSRKTKKEHTDEKDNPFLTMLKDINGVEKR